MSDPFDDESLARALRAPGSDSELGEEERYVAMFREARDAAAPPPVPMSGRRRRVASRFGAGSAFVVALAVGGSAAAAYTNNLPEPIQRFAHRALGPVAPPAPDEHHHRAKDRSAAAPTPSATPTPTPTPSESPIESPTPSSKPSPSAKPSPTPAPSATPIPTPTPSATPTPTPTPTPTATPTSTPTSTPTVVPPPVVAAVGISGTTHRVEPGQSVAFSGTVTSEDGSPMRKKRVTLQARYAGGWAPVASGRTGDSGQVSLVLPPISASTAVRLRADGVHSARWRVTLHPQLSVTSTRGETAGTVVITATALGAQPGDQVQLMTKSGEVASGTLDAGGSVSFAVSPTAKKTRYTVLLPATQEHGPDHAAIRVVVRKPGA